MHSDISDFGSRQGDPRTLAPDEDAFDEDRRRLVCLTSQAQAKTLVILQTHLAKDRTCFLVTCLYMEAFHR